MTDFGMCPVCKFPVGSLRCVHAVQFLAALQDIADAERAEGADPHEWALWAHDRAREALALNQGVRP